MGPGRLSETTWEERRSVWPLSEAGAAGDVVWNATLEVDDVVVAVEESKAGEAGLVFAGGVVEGFGSFGEVEAVAMEREAIAGGAGWVEVVERVLEAAADVEGDADAAALGEDVGPAGGFEGLVEVVVGAALDADGGGEGDAACDLGFLAFELLAEDVFLAGEAGDGGAQGGLGGGGAGERGLEAGVVGGGRGLRAGQRCQQEQGEDGEQGFGTRMQGADLCEHRIRKA